MQNVMTVPSAEELDSFKYSDLQDLAKRLGFWANLRADKLRVLKAHLNPETRKEVKVSVRISLLQSPVLRLRYKLTVRGKLKGASYVTKARKRHKTVYGVPNFQDHSEKSDPTIL